VALTTYIIWGRVQVVDAERNGGIELEPIIDGETQVGEIEVHAAEPFEAFRKIGAVNAHSTDQALRKAAEQHGDGFYAAVSERHWKTEEFETETVTRVRAKSA